MTDTDRLRDLRDAVQRALIQCMSLVLLKRGTERDLSGFLAVLESFMANGFSVEETYAFRQQANLQAFYQKQGGKDAAWANFLADCSVRTRKVLAQAGIESLDVLIAMRDVELLAHKGCGRTTVNEIKQRLEERGFGLKPDKYYR